MGFIVDWSLRYDGNKVVLVRRQRVDSEEPKPWRDVAVFIDDFWARSVLAALQREVGDVPCD